MNAVHKKTHTHNIGQKINYLECDLYKDDVYKNINKKSYVLLSKKCVSYRLVNCPENI
jgi:hypothetical protein